MRPQGRQLGGIRQIVGAAPTHGVCRPRECRTPLRGIPKVDISRLPSGECEISRLATGGASGYSRRCSGGGSRRLGGSLALPRRRGNDAGRMGSGGRASPDLGVGVNYSSLPTARGRTRRSASLQEEETNGGLPPGHIGAASRRVRPPLQWPGGGSEKDWRLLWEVSGLKRLVAEAKVRFCETHFVAGGRHALPMAGAVRGVAGLGVRLDGRDDLRSGHATGAP